MLLFDTNVLVYAANRRFDVASSVPTAARRSASRPVPGVSYLERLLRVPAGATHPRVLPSPWKAGDACRFVSDLLASPGFDLLIATPRHQSVLAQTLLELPRPPR